MSNIKRKGREYRPGQKPAWLDEQQRDDETIRQDHDNVKKTSSKAAKNKILVRVQESFVENDGNHVPAAAVVRVATIETDGLEIPEAAVELDEEEEAEERRRRYRSKMAIAVDDAMAETLEEVEEAEEEEEEVETEEEEESEEDDQDYGKMLIKPVFVSKEQRKTVDDRSTILAQEEEQRKLREESKAERKIEANAKLIEAIERGEMERELAVKSALAEMPDDTDIPNDAVEIEKWRLREMVRVLRDRQERANAAEELAETERRRLLSDQEIISNMKGSVEAAPQKGKIKFLQRYHHKGVFFQDKVDPELLQRDYTVATGLDAEIDRSLLPKVLQVKNFGLASRTKYTHLTDQDTSRDDPWSASTVSAPKGYGKQRRADDVQSSNNKRYRTDSNTS